MDYELSAYLILESLPDSFPRFDELLCVHHIRVDQRAQDS